MRLGIAYTLPHNSPQEWAKKKQKPRIDGSCFSVCIYRQHEKNR